MQICARSYFTWPTVMAAAFTLAGCAVFNIQSPTANTPVNSPVSAQINWGASLQANTFKVVVDPAGSNTDVTSQFNITTNPNGSSVATANLSISPGSHTLLVGGNLWTWYDQKYDFTSTTVNFTVNQPTLSMSLSPNPANIPVGGNATVTVNVAAGAGIGSPATVSVGNLPNGVSATPQVFNVNISSGAGNNTTVISASSSASPGPATIGVSASASTGQSASQSLALNIGSAPHINSVMPAVQTRGGNVTISGSGFDPHCANDSITINGGTVTPSGTCSATSVTVQIPQQAGFKPNPGLLTLKTKAGTSNGVNFTVARQSGSFVNITGAIEGQVSNQNCTTGAVNLKICNSSTSTCGSNYPYVASFSNASGNSPIGQQIPFHKNNTRVAGLGGAGFSQCTVGAVLDGDTTAISPQLMGIQFMDLTTGSRFPSGGDYFFNYVTPAGNASYVPQIWRSPDGTVFIIVTASTIGPSQLTAAVIDQYNPGYVNANCQSSNATNAFSALITTTNQVSINLAGTSCNAIPIN